MSLNLIEKLQEFRNQLYLRFPKRKDAILNLLDALSSYGHQCKSVVQLSTSPYFERQYSSITDALADGLPEASWDDILILVYQVTVLEPDESMRFIIDCTPNPRPHARTLPDRTITHLPNPAPGNKPIVVGHQYSTVVVAPTESARQDKHWVVPLSAKRVKSDEKGNELGMKQLNECIETLNRSDKLNISVADSLYGSDKCREIAVSKENLVHIFRMRNNRNIFLKPAQDDAETKSRKGRKQEYGDKHSLSDGLEAHEADEVFECTRVTKKGKTHLIVIKCWRDVLLRGTAEFRSSEHPINLIRVTATDETNKSVFKRPLWLGVLGERRHELTLEDVQQTYAQRYDTEHFYRFGKQNLLLDGHQTPDVQHEELWWKLSCLAYVQLYLSSGIVPSIPNPWERYLPEFKEDTEEEGNQAQKTSSPSKTQRGFSKVLEQIGTPAAACVPRGNPQGRALGESQIKREVQPVIFKTKKKPEENTENAINSETELDAKKSKPETIEMLLSTVQAALKNLNFTLEDFSKLLANSS
jgi:hypothetical protein